MAGRGRGRGWLSKFESQSKEMKPFEQKTNPVEQKSNNSNGFMEKNSTLSKLMAKYNYKANPNSPAGFKELSIRQSEELFLLSEHKEQPHWWLVRNKAGEEGYSPKSYLMKMETKVASLPWLENKKTVEINTKVVPTHVAPKKYVSAYKENQGKSDIQWHCDVCNKSFNGPHPYNSHMVSKAHREEVEVAQLYGRM
nr:tyrosine-protein kinase ITK/TSK [Ciona intestinalis]|eukprot:XP_026694070.1 tyrosine-protein kinase ITK/TSK [Ciona intestinalis]